MDDLFRFAYWLSGDRSLAEDLVQGNIDPGLEVAGPAQGHEGRKELAADDRAPRECAALRASATAGVGNTDRGPGRRAQRLRHSTEAFVLRRALDRLTSEYREPLLMQVVYGYSQRRSQTDLASPMPLQATRLFVLARR